MTNAIRRHAMRTTSAAAAAVLLVGILAGCSSSGSKPSSDITGAQSGPTTATASATPSPAATQLRSAPPIALPQDFTVQVDFKPSTDAVKDKVAQDLSYALKAFNEAQAKGDINTPGMLYAYTGTAGAYMNQAVQQLKSKGLTITGTSRYYALTVEPKDATHAVVAYCEDQSKGYAKEVSTGKVLTTTPSINDYTDWTVGLELSDKGVWRVASPLAEKGSTRCQSVS